MSGRTGAFCGLLFCGLGCLHGETAKTVGPAQPVQDFLLLGVVPMHDPQGNPCPNGFRRVDALTSPLAWLIAIVTIGTYWGRTEDVWCADKPLDRATLVAAPSSE